MTVFLLAQAGVPLTSGFVAKFGVIQAGVGVHSYALSIIAMITAVIAAFLYLRIMISMWAHPRRGRRRRPRGRAYPGARRHRDLRLGAFTLAIGFVPAWIIDVAGGVVQLAQ